MSFKLIHVHLFCLFVHLAMLPYISTIRKNRNQPIFAIEKLNNKQSLNK